MKSARRTTETHQHAFWESSIFGRHPGKHWWVTLRLLRERSFYAALTKQLQYHAIITTTTNESMDNGYNGHMDRHPGKHWWVTLMLLCESSFYGALTKQQQYHDIITTTTNESMDNGYNGYSDPANIDGWHWWCFARALSRSLTKQQQYQAIITTTTNESMDNGYNGYILGWGPKKTTITNVVGQPPLGF